eukprot:1607131-Prymnesium_polylepis.1
MLQAALEPPFRSSGAVPYDYTHACSAADASLILRQQGLAATRCTLATLSILTMMLRAVSLSIATAQEFRERVRDGREPLFRGVEQRVIRLCGRSSDVTELSLARYGAHIVPVFERPEEVRALVAAHSHGFRRPVYWQVSEGAYSQMASWAHFTISPEFFLRTTTGRRLLYLEADTTNWERSLSLSARSTDLSMEDASQAFRLIETAARKMLDERGLPRGLRTLRVVLGDPRQCESSAWRQRDLRSRVHKLREADVLIDSQASVLEAALRWCASVGAPPRFVDEPATLEERNAQREAAHAAAEEVAEQAEELAGKAVKRAARKTHAAEKAAAVAADEEALACATRTAEGQQPGVLGVGNSLAADAAVSALSSARRAARAAADAHEASLIA